jgi:hypothetical protein
VQAGLVFAYSYQFSVADGACPTGQTCELLPYAAPPNSEYKGIKVDKNQATNVQLAVNQQQDDGPTYLTSKPGDGNLQVSLELQAESLINRLRVTHGDPETFESRAVHMRLYASPDGVSWERIEHLHDGFYGVDGQLLPGEASIISEDGSGGKDNKINFLTTYSESGEWSVMFPARLVRFFRIDIQRADGFDSAAGKITLLLFSRCPHL